MIRLVTRERRLERQRLPVLTTPKPVVVDTSSTVSPLTFYPTGMDKGTNYCRERLRTVGTAEIDEPCRWIHPVALPDGISFSINQRKF